MGQACTPTMIMTILPIMRTMFPPSFIKAPPFSHRVVVLRSPTNNFRYIKFPTLVVRVVEHRTGIRHASRYCTASSSNSYKVVSNHATYQYGVGTISDVVSSTCTPSTCVPSPMTSPIETHCSKFNYIVKNAIGRNRDEWGSFCCHPCHTFGSNRQTVPCRMFSSSMKWRRGPSSGVIVPFLIF